MNSEQKKKEESLREYLLERIVISPSIVLERVEENQILVTQNPYLLMAQGFNPEINPRNLKKFCLFFGCLKEGSAELYLDTVMSNLEQGAYTLPIFYKDGKNLLVRLGSRSHYKRESSLIQYDKPKRERMIHLRDIEKIALALQPHNNQLIYFQPDTPRRKRSLRVYNMEDVFLDRSNENHLKRVKSLDYRIASEKTIIPEGKLDIKIANPHMKILTLRSESKP